MDVASYANARNRVTASLLDPQSNSGDAAGDSYRSIEGLRGSARADTLIGNESDNVLNGGGGPDRLSGGDGNDTFELDTVQVASRIVIIEDLTPDTDRIALARSIFAQAGPIGTLASNAFHVGAAAHDAEDRIIYNTVTGILLYDADGLGGQAAVAFASVSPGLSLSAADIRIV